MRVAISYVALMIAIYLVSFNLVRTQVQNILTRTAMSSRASCLVRPLLLKEGGHPSPS